MKLNLLKKAANELYDIAIKHTNNTDSIDIQIMNDCVCVNNFFKVHKVNVSCTIVNSYENEETKILKKLGFK